MMKHTKRILLSLLAGLVALTVFAACDEGPYIPDEEEDDDDSPKVTTTVSTTAGDEDNPPPETNPEDGKTPETDMHPKS